MVIFIVFCEVQLQHTLAYSGSLSLTEKSKASLQSILYMCTEEHFKSARMYITVQEFFL